MGILQFPPDVFWAMTLPELYAAIDGLAEYNGGGDKQEPLSRDELSELMELYPD